MPFADDDLDAWLVGVLADAGSKKLTRLVLGADQPLALRSAATAAQLPLDSQLNHDVTHHSYRGIEGLLVPLVGKVRRERARRVPRE